MLIIGNKYNVNFPMGITKLMTLKEIHEPKTIHQILYTFIDSNNAKVMFTNSVFNRLTITEPIQTPDCIIYIGENNPLPPPGFASFPLPRETKKDWLTDDDLYS
jgi:hypothetical protein